MNDHDPTEHLWHHWPQAWYPVARVSGFAPGKVHNGHLCGREWVLYRGEDGVFRATDAFCPHMGAHLKSARVDGCSLECGPARLPGRPRTTNRHRTAAHQQRLPHRRTGLALHRTLRTGLATPADRRTPSPAV